MLKLKRAAGTVLAAVVLGSALLFAGCSTPKDAMTVDGRTYSTGEYLAYLYNVYYSMASQMQMYAMYGMDPWAQKLPYGEGDDEVELSTAEYIKKVAQDSIIRQKALENMMNEKGIEWDEEKLQELNDNLADLKSDAFIALGFNNKSYIDMLKATTLNEYSLFYGLYDNGGERAMSEDEIRAYFDENFLSYKIIEISLVDSQNKPLSDEEITEIKDRINKYKEAFDETEMTSEDFDKIIEQYEEDEEKAAEEEDEDEDGEDETDSTTATTTDTTTAESTTNATTAATDTTASGEETGSTTAADEGSDENDEEDEEETDPNRHDIDANTFTDEDLANAIKKVEIGTAGIQEYKKNGSYDTIALIYRMDPEADRGEDVDYFADSREDIIYGAHYEEFDKEVEEYIATLTVELNDAAIKACNPKNFEKDAAKL